MCDTPTSYPLLPFGWPPPRKKENVISCACPFAYCFFSSTQFFCFFFSLVTWTRGGRNNMGIRVILKPRSCTGRTRRTRLFCFQTRSCLGSFFFPRQVDSSRHTHPRQISIKTCCHVCANPSCSYFVLNELIERVQTFARDSYYYIPGRYKKSLTLILLLLPINTEIRRLRRSTLSPLAFK